VKKRDWFADGSQGHVILFFDDRSSGLNCFYYVSQLNIIEWSPFVRPFNILSSVSPIVKVAGYR